MSVQCQNLVLSRLCSCAVKIQPQIWGLQVLTTLNSCSVFLGNWTAKPVWNPEIRISHEQQGNWNLCSWSECAAPFWASVACPSCWFCVTTGPYLTGFSLCCCSGKSSGPAIPPPKLDGSKVIKFYYSGRILSACAHSVSLLWHKITCWNRYRRLLVARSKIRHDGVLAKSSSRVLDQQLWWNALFWIVHVSCK